MTQRVQLPNGQFGVFPDEMSQEDILAVLQKQFPPEQSEPTKPEPTTVMSRTGRPLDPFQGQEQTDIGYTDNPLADATAGAMGTGLALAGPAAAVGGALASGGLGAGAQALLPLAGRAAAGAAVGGAAGSVPIPGIGPLGAKEGAILGGGIAIGKNPGGTGALFRHGMKVKGLHRLLQYLGLSGADDVTRGAASGGGRDAIIAADQARRAHLAEQAVAKSKVLGRRQVGWQNPPPAPLRGNPGPISPSVPVGTPPAPLPAMGSAPGAVRSVPPAPLRGTPGPMPAPAPVGAVPARPPAMGSAPGAARVAPAPPPALARTPPPAAGPAVAPTSLEAQLRASLSGEAPAPFAGERIARGAQRVAPELGMTKEAVRQQAGPVLDEAVGAASPILPKQALQSIIDTMKKMPMAEREAYVARATSGKTKWQVENIRRTLEHLGLLLPAGMAAGAVSGESY